jgi:hypothetical protein
MMQAWTITAASTQVTQHSTARAVVLAAVRGTGWAPRAAHVFMKAAGSHACTTMGKSMARDFDTRYRCRQQEDAGSSNEKLTRTS